MNTALIESGGIGLVSFHLARSGHEFVRTMDRSSHGDIWATIAGQMVSIEVKTGTKRQWSVARSQKRADFYCLVHLLSAHTYVLTAAEVDDIMRSAKDGYPGVVAVRQSMLPKAALDAWGRMACSVLAAKELVPRGRVIGVHRRYLKQPDGSVKIWDRPRRAIRATGDLERPADAAD